uniref:Dynactin domain-containing protein n=1 Tax=Macrostomum lignano TaxID=282301 RepID=A0A1I8F1J8_9PLAT
MNDELLESSRETESGLREQLELRQGALNELKRMYNCLQDSVDQLIEQLRKGALDENCDMAALERLLHYMDDLYRINLAALPADPATCLRGLASMAGYAGEAFGSTVDRMKACLPSILTAESQAKSLFVKLTSLKSEFASKGRSIRRRLPADSRQQPLRLPEPVRQRLDASIGQLSTAMRALQHACREMHQAPEFDSVTAVVGFLLAGVETVYDLKGAASLDRLDKELDGASSTLCIEHGEFDFDGTKTSADVRPTEPATTKLAMVEKRLETTKKEYEDRCGRLQVLLEQTESQLKKKTAEFEQTLEALQSDIDSLESERHELRDKLKSLSKKNLLEGLTSRVPAVAGQQPGLLQQLAQAHPAVAAAATRRTCSASLRRPTALQFATSENARLRSERLRRELARLKPLAPPPRKPTGLDQSLTGLCQASKSPAPGVPELWRRSCDLAGELKRQLLEDGGVGVVQLTHPRQEPPERQLAEVAGEVASTSSVPARPRLAGERRPTPGPAFEQCRLVGRLRCGQADSGEGVVRVALAPERSCSRCTSVCWSEF